MLFHHYLKFVEIIRWLNDVNRTVLRAMLANTDYSNPTNGSNDKKKQVLI